MADFLDQKLKEIRDRLKELKPAVDEYERLEAAERALSGATTGGGSAARSAGGGPSRSGRPSRGATAAAARRGATGSANGRRGRPKGSGTRAKEALALVEARPGITIPEMAEAMGIKQNYLYRVMPTLAGEGKVAKSGRGWHVKK